MLVKKAMINKVITIQPEKTAKDAARLMKEQKIGSVIVSENGFTPLGIITETDVTKIVAGDRHTDEVLIKEFMSTEIISINEDEQLDIASMKMAKHKIKKLIVLSHKGELKGIITNTNIIEHSQDLKNESLFE